jgi:hypothetical protein
MTDDIVYGPGAFTLIAMRPCFRKISQQGVQRAGSAAEERQGLLEIMSHFRVPGTIDYQLQIGLIEEGV